MEPSAAVAMMFILGFLMGTGVRVVILPMQIQLAHRAKKESRK